MRSRERFAAAALLALVVGFVATAVGAVVHRSLIPRSLHATVTAVEVRHEKHPGIDDVWLLHLDGEPVHVDARTAQRLSEGSRVRKEAWQESLTVDGEARPLELSDDARAMLKVMPVIVLAALASLASTMRWQD